MSRVADSSTPPVPGPSARLAPVVSPLRLIGPLLIWLVVMVAGAATAWFATGTFDPVGKVAVALAIPALVSMLLAPVLHRIWAQIVLLTLWTGFAIVTTLVAGLFPAAALFIAIPALAMLFTRERVAEATVLAAIAFVAAFCILAFGLVDLGDVPVTEEARDFAGLLAGGGTLGLLLASMIAGTQARDLVPGDDVGPRWGDGVIGGLFEFDRDDRLVRANGEGRRQFGLDYLSKDVRLSDMADYSAARQSLIDSAESARRVGTPAVTRIALGTGQAPASHLDLHFTPLAGGGLLLHALDRTDEADRLEALRRDQTVAEREAREKTLFFAGVSHELRTPLNAIIGFSDMMRSRLFGPLPSKYSEYAELIHDSGQYMLDLIGDVLDLSKVEAGKYTLVPDTFDATDVVRSSVKMIRPAADAAEVEIDLSLPDDDLLLTADRKAVRQMLLNLMSNAVKFSPKGSRIDVAARQDGDDMIISVTDQGPGMSELEIARIGQPYSQGASGREVEARGSGLGLSLVRQLAELHGGRFEVRSKIGAGTDARIVLPALGQT